MLYLAFHGEPNAIQIGKDLITLEDLADRYIGKFNGKIVHFGSCSTLNIDRRLLKNFLKKTDAVCISGYRKNIDFVISAAFEILYFSTCQNYKTISLINRDLNKFYKCLVKENQFEMIYL